MAVKEEKINPEQNVPQVDNSALEKVTEQVKVLRQTQELEALKAGFKNADEYKKALGQLELDRNKFEEYKNKEDNKLQTEELILAQKGSDVIEKVAKNKRDAEHIVEVGKDYQVKWEAEDLERKAILEKTIRQLKDLYNMIQGLHHRYITDTARQRILNLLNPILQLFGTELPTDDYTVLETHNDGDTPSNLREAHTICCKLYQWIQREPLYGLGFARWAFQILKGMDRMLIDKTDDEVVECEDRLMVLMRVFNLGVLKLVEKYEEDKNNKVDYTATINYLCQVSNKIEQLCGVSVIAR